MGCVLGCVPLMICSFSDTAELHVTTEKALGDFGYESHEVH